MPDMSTVADQAGGPSTETEYEGLETRDPGEWTYGDREQYTVPHHSDGECPHCEKPVVAEIEWGDFYVEQEEEFELRCWSCRTVFFATYAMVPEFDFRSTSMEAP